MTVLYIAGRWPWPVRVGRQRMINQILQLASEITEVDLLAFSAPGVDVSQAPNFVRSSGTLPRPGIMGILANLFKAPLDPLQCHLFNSDKASAIVLDRIKALNPDFIVIDMIRLFSFARHIKKAFPDKKLILDMDDMLSTRYTRMLASKNLNGITGTFEKKLPGPVRFMAAVTPRLFLEIEKVLVARLEMTAYAVFDRIMLVSPKEAEVLNKANRGGKAVAMPPMICKHEPLPRHYDKGLRFVFIGNANYAPNAEALAVLDRVAGRLKSAYPKPAVPFKFEVAGARNDSLRLDNLDILDFVDDLEVFLGGDAVMVAPIMTGTGIKTKIIDALEYGVPIVTTPLGVEGLPLSADDHYVEMTDEYDLYTCLEGLINNPTARSGLESMGSSALLHVYQENNHSTLLGRLSGVLALTAIEP